MTDSVIEEKTPKGYVFKINIQKRQFIAFTPKGEMVYSDENKTKPFHSMKIAAFLGFEVNNPTKKQSYQLFKVHNQSMVVPYSNTHTKREYLFIPTDSPFDMLPCAIEYFDNLSSLISFAKRGSAPHFIIINTIVSDLDIKLITSLCQSSSIHFTNKTLKNAVDDTKRAVDQMSSIDINLLSNNPVFLARVHLRNLDFSRVKQLLLDMDITHSDATFIRAFLSIMVDRADKQELAKHLAVLMELKKAFDFYVHLLALDEDEVKKLIDRAAKSDLVTYYTLVQKAKLLLPAKEESLRLVEYENYIWEKQQ